MLLPTPLTPDQEDNGHRDREDCGKEQHDVAERDDAKRTDAKRVLEVLSRSQVVDRQRHDEYERRKPPKQDPKRGKWASAS
jgi:hypothetical protein